ncbi:hypothetical protein GLOIN_2v1783204 [Rhizophagus clarus]|uniref:Uncharacterized protein n=1 Tax=Rhizophagus clarus TaxID=94130 RepID=A0A8H3LVM7_9GLOM|nr:hypothetical protein GLOIN_2v1783204 [Rhizophagus clarus]
MVKTRNGDPNHAELLKSKSSGSREESLPNYLTFHTVNSVQEISVNTSAQKKTTNEIQITEKKLTEFEQIYNITTDSQFRLDIYKKIGDLQDEIKSNKERIIKLKRNANYAQKCREKKEKYLTKIRKEVIKVQIIKNLHKTLIENYNIYMARTILNNYLLSQQFNSIAARAHHHPAWVTVAGISYTKIWDYPDSHYCLASIKSARQFATVFADKTVIISQDDKVKIGLGVSAVDQTFRTLQSVYEPISVADHDFPLGNRQKLVPSVYLMIKPNKSHDELQTGQLTIFVRR